MKQIVYVASPESQQIHVWQLDDAGALALLQTVDVPGQVQPIAIHPDKRYLYVGVRPAFGVVSYRIEEDGRLQEAGMAPLPGGPTHISTDLQGRYLFSVSYSGNCASVSPIGEDGVVAAPLQEINGLTAPHSANIDPTNQLVLIPCLKEDRIRLFDLSPQGQLAPHSQPEIDAASGAGPRHMTFHPNQRYAYCVNELDSTVDVLAIGEDGKKYTTVQTLDVMPADFSGTRWAADIHITPDGRFLYTSDRTASILTIFRVAQDGSALSVVGHHPTEQQPRGFNIDHSGRYVISAGQQSDHIEVYAINSADGTLKTLARYPVGKGPMWVSILAQ